MIRRLLLSLFIVAGLAFQQSNFFITNKGEISFRSEAQQEFIKASSSSLRGVIDPANRTFIFKVLLRTFEGFNSALQQEHFNEKYLESEKYPEAIFSGKIIEDIDLSIDGTYEVRAKGKFSIHGVDVEKIIRSKVIVKDGTMNIESHFSILLSDYNIKIPRVVHEKIASEILIDLTAALERKQ
jgi:hypothetical protein